METTIYRCVSSDCSKSYRRLSNLQAHLSMVISCFSGTHQPWNVDQILAQHDLAEARDALESFTNSTATSRQNSQRNTRSREGNCTKLRKETSSKAQRSSRNPKAPSLALTNSLSIKRNAKEEVEEDADPGGEEPEDGGQQEISMALHQSKLTPAEPANSSPPQILTPFVAAVETRHDYHLVGNCQRLINLNNAPTLEKLHQAVLQGLPAAPGMDSTWDVYALKVNVRRAKGASSDKQYEVGSEESWGLLFMLMKQLEDTVEVSIMARLRVKSTQA